MNILIVEDEITSRLILTGALKKLGHSVVSTQDAREAWELLQTEEFSTVISDWMMPGLNGLELCRLIRSEYRGPYVYTIVVTALDGKADYLNAMESGADDFITKPLDEAQLAARLRVAERILELQSNLRTMALHDSLTGLFSRAAILQMLSRELDASKRTRDEFGVVLCDLDHFKQVNDTYGHLVGDAVLTETAHRMASTLRSYDRIGRYGGEEFLVVLPRCNRSEALDMAERLRVSISASKMASSAGMLSCTCSVGVAMSESGALHSDALIQAADLALYRAKSDGRNCVRIGSARLALTP